jgi:hypothetical protein
MLTNSLRRATSPTFDGSSCTNSAALAGGDKFQIAGGVLAWGTSSHSCTSTPGSIPPVYARINTRVEPAAGYGDHGGNV